jgi:putative oxidoreductase
MRLNCLIVRYLHSIELLDALAPWLALLLLRLLIGWEFLESGLEKFHGENWFGEIQSQFPFPFSVIPVEISWAVATGFEMVGGIALMLGMGTRFFAASLLVLTVVATAAVHWPAEWHSLVELAQGYAITDKGYGNFKLPLLFLAMLLPLIFMGAGKLSLDAVVRHLYKKKGGANAALCS